jgi:hypothetical protein
VVQVFNQNNANIVGDMMDQLRSFTRNDEYLLLREPVLPLLHCVSLIKQSLLIITKKKKKKNIGNLIVYTKTLSSISFFLLLLFLFLKKKQMHKG